MNLSDILKQYRKKNNLTMDELASKVNVSKAYISMLEKNKNSTSGKPIKPSLTTLKKIAIAMNISLDALLNLLDDDTIISLKTNQPLISTSYPKKEINFLPSHHYTMIPYSVSAGALSEIESLHDLPTVNVPDSMLGKYAGSKHIILMPVNGESMNNVINHESIIAVKTDVELINLHNGDIVVISNEGDYTVKRYFNDTINQRFIFRPDSTCPEFTEIIFSYANANDLELIGKVVMYNVFL